MGQTQAALIGRNGKKRAGPEPALARRRRGRGVVPPGFGAVSEARTGRKRAAANRGGVGRIGRTRDRVGASVQATASRIARSIENADVGRGGVLKNRIDAVDVGGRGLILAIRPTVAD